MAHCPRLRTLALSLGVAVTLSMFAAPASAAPRNDDFQNARAIRAGAALQGTINGATKQPGEPRHARTLAARSVWYRFRAERSLTVSLNTCGASFDSVLAAYTGRSLRSLKVIKYNNNGCDVVGGSGSRIAFAARPGQIYSVAVAGFAPRGTFRLKVARLAVPRNDNFAEAVPIGLDEAVGGTTRDATRELGERTRGGVHTVWYRFSVTTPRLVRLDACSSDDPPRIAVYTGQQVNRLRLVAGVDDCFVFFSARLGVIYRVAIAETSRGSHFRLATRAADPPANDNFADATEISMDSTTPATTRDATREPGEPVTANNRHQFTVWFRLTLPAGATVQLTACPAGESQIALFQGAQLEQLTLIGALNCRIGLRARNETVVFYIQVTTLRDANFNLIAQATQASQRQRD